jgi:hypothetical protein
MGNSVTTLKTKSERLEFKNETGKKLVIEINTGDAEKISAWLKVIDTYKKDFGGSDYIAVKEGCRKIVSSILSDKIFDKIVKFCNNNISCIMIIVLDLVEKIISAQKSYTAELEAKAEVLKNVMK